MFIANFIRRRRNGVIAGDNPWGADTLEWPTSSPPPDYNFVHLPTVHGRYALWSSVPGDPVVTGLRTDRREGLVTAVLDAKPDHRYLFPASSIWPLVTALAMAAGLIPSVFIFRYILIGVALTAIALFGWFWPRPDPEVRELDAEVPE